MGAALLVGFGFELFFWAESLVAKSLFVEVELEKSAVGSTRELFWKALHQALGNAKPHLPMLAFGYSFPLRKHTWSGTSCKVYFALHFLLRSMDFFILAAFCVGAERHWTLRESN